MRLPTSIELGRVLWDFLSAGRSCGQAEAIIICCSYDLRIADYALELAQSQGIDKFVITGKTGNWTKDIWPQTEAAIFLDYIKNSKIYSKLKEVIIEDKATNFAENIAFSRNKIPDAHSVIFVAKPNSIKRILNTAPIQWPGLKFHAAAPSFKYPGEISQIIGQLGIIDEMVGDIHRLMRYPRYGYMIEQYIPVNVSDAWKELIHRGFDRHLLAGEALS